MLFKLRSAGYVFDSEGVEVRALTQLGFTFKPMASIFSPCKGSRVMLDKDVSQINIDTLEELMTFQRVTGHEIFLCDDTITIYNDYME